MKKIIHTCCFRPALLKAVLLAIMVFVGGKGVAQEWLWADGAGSPAQEGVSHMVTDQYDNVYVGLYLSSDGGGGTIHFNTATLVCNGANDTFIVKYDANGNELWVRQIGGDNPFWPQYYGEYMTGLEFDTVTNGLYATGIFYDHCNFGNGIALDGWYQDIYVARYDADGNCQWAKRAGSYEREYSSAIGTDETGALFMTLALTQDGVIDTTGYGYGGYLLKYTSDGVNLWTKKIHNDEYSTFPALDFREIKSVDGLIYLYGDNNYTVFTIDTISCINPGYYGEILVCMNSEGSALWLKQFGGPKFRAICLSFAMDLNKNFYFAGAFQDDFATFGNDTVFSTATTYDMFIYKCNAFGETVWVKQANASKMVYGDGISVSGDGMMLCTGSIKGIASFGDFSLQTTGNDGKMFVVQYNTSGECLNAELLFSGYGGPVIINDSNQMVVSGSFRDTISIGNTVLISNGYVDFFTAKRQLPQYGSSIYERQASRYLHIYANPSTGICNISIPEELQHEENLTLLVYDNAGKLILQQVINMQEEKISLNLQAEAKGIYNAILTNGKQKYQGKVVLE